MIGGGGIIAKLGGRRLRLKDLGVRGGDPDGSTIRGISAGAVCTKASSQRARKMLKYSI